jgi:hypothetical protein
VTPVRLEQEFGRPFRLCDLRGPITAFFARVARLVLADVDALVVELQAVATAMRDFVYLNPGHDPVLLLSSSRVPVRYGSWQPHAGAPVLWAGAPRLWVGVRGGSYSGSGRSASSRNHAAFSAGIM